MTPQLMLEYLENHVLHAGPVPTHLDGKKCKLFLQLDLAVRVKNSDGKTRKGSNFFKIQAKNADNASNNFMSYICNYHRGKINHVFIGNDADYCFTTTMNSCSFGIGQQTGAGVLVSHANAAGTGAKSAPEMFNKQNQWIKDYHGENVTVFEPSDYLKDDKGVGNKHFTTTVGLRMNGKWSFYAQSFFYHANQNVAVFERFQGIGTNNF